MKIRILISLLISILFLNCGFAYAAGPWKGKVIDSETKEPVEGAVVLAMWERVYRTPTGANSYFYESKETLTDKDGFFKISWYLPINLLPIISYMSGPEFIIFKPGYGILRMELGDYLTGGTTNTKEMVISGKIYRLSPGIIELPKLKTREERLKAIGSLPPRIPYEKMRKLLKLMNAERISLGLQPYALGENFNENE